MRRVVITGMGITSPLGSTVKDAFERLKIYKNCVEHWEKLDEYERLNTSLGAFVKDFEVPERFTRKVKRTMGNVALMAVVTAEEALKDAGLLGDEIITNGRTGVSYGSSTGSLDAILDFYSMCIETPEFRFLHQNDASDNSCKYFSLFSNTRKINPDLNRLYFGFNGHRLRI